MSRLTPEFGIALAVYASTNIDNLLVLSLFFAEHQLQPRLIVAGHFLGMVLIVGLSVAIGLGALALPPGYVSFLGVFPLALGVRRLGSLWVGREGKPRAASGEKPAAARTGDQGIEARKTTYSQVLAVAGVAIANGGDNLAAYVALFARSPAAIPFYVTAFLALTAVWCAAAHWIASNHLVEAQVRRVGRAVFPFAMIALAAWILAGTRILFR